MTGRRAGTVSSWVLPHLIAYVDAGGRDAAPLRTAPGLRGRDLADPDARIADGAAVEVWRLAREITGDEALGLHLAQAIPRGALDLMEYAFRSSATLEAACAQLARYGRALSDRLVVGLDREASFTTLTFGYQEPVIRDPQRAEFSLAFVLRLARESTGVAVVPREVAFAHPAPVRDGEHRAYFGAGLQFGRPWYRIRFDRADAVRPLLAADPALAGVVGRRLDALLAKLPSQDDSASIQVRRALLTGLARGDSTAAVTARHLGVAERTLHRRLRAEGAAYRDVLDELRGELATTLLREPRIGIAEIAFLLGYSEAAAFHRFFRRWSGQTPIAFRRAAGAREG